MGGEEAEQPGHLHPGDGGERRARGAVPEPFGGEPEVQASDGYYSLYWLIPGAPPTYLRITGTAGGEIPAYSYYDRNVQLEQNDSVMGYPAWHDDTPIYDLVYWQVGNVVYTVESHNLVSDTTMGIANSLMSLVIPDTSGEPAGGERRPVVPRERARPGTRESA